MKFCKVCVFPDTKPDLMFNREGVCSACQFAFSRKKEIDYEARKTELLQIADRYRRKDNYWDCIVPVSGGKDSTYQIWYVKEVLKMNPLAVHFEPTERTELGARSLRALREIGVDCITWFPTRRPTPN